MDEAKERADFEAWFQKRRQATWEKAGCHKDRGPTPSEFWSLCDRHLLLEGWEAASTAMAELSDENAQLREQNVAVDEACASYEAENKRLRAELSLLTRQRTEMIAEADELRASLAAQSPTNGDSFRHGWECAEQAHPGWPADPHLMAKHNALHMNHIALKEDVRKISDALTSVGLTLIRKEHGYEVRRFGKVEAQATPAQAQQAAPMTQEQVNSYILKYNSTSAVVRAVERDRAAAWGVKLAGIGASSGGAA